MTLRQPLVALIAIVAALCVAMSFAGVVYCYFYDPELSGLNSLSAWRSSSWTVTNTTQFNAGIPIRVNTTNNEVKLNRTTGNPFAQVYALGGGGTTMFWRYDVGGNTWTTLASTLSPVSAGGALIVDGGDTLFAFAGGGTRTFMMYYVSSNSWITRASPPANIGPGGALTYAGTFAYAFAGGNTATFMRYSPATNTWATMASAPVPINAGGSLTWAGGDYIYALAGGETTTFLRYSISGNSWVTMPPVPLAVGPGGSITFEGGSKLYAITGGGGAGKRDVYQYNITLMTWTKMRDTQNPVSDGAAVTWDGGSYLFVLKGTGSNGFWKYTVATDTWGNAANTPGNVGPGGAVSYVPGTGGTSCYNSPGSVASVVFDTGTANTRWDLLSWNASVPAGTSITMEVRSSNTLFLMDDQTIPWTFVTGTSQGGTRYTVPYSSLPSGRYHQWRARLYSSVCGATPVLYDETVYFSSGISLITAMNGLVSMRFDLGPDATPDFSRPGGVVIANPPYDPYTGAPSAAATTLAPLALPASPANATTATPAATAANATVTPVPNATVTLNATVNTTPAVAANLTINATATPVETPTANATPTRNQTVNRASPAANATETPVPSATVPDPTPGIPYATPTPGSTAPLPNETVAPATPEPTVTVTATETPAPPTLMEVAGADRNLTIFVALAREAGLDATLDGPGPYTVFAPTDDAFERLPPSELDRLRADPALLVRVLDRHVVIGAFDMPGLAALPALAGLDGMPINVTARAGTVAVENATVNYTAPPAANGVLHAVDAVIVPIAEPTPSPTPASSPAPTPSATETMVAEAPVTPPATIATQSAAQQVITTLETAVTARATTPWAKYRPDAAG